MISDRMFGYAISKAAQHISVKNTAPVYFHEFGYSGNYSTIALMDPKSYSRGSSKSYILYIYYFICIYKTKLIIHYN
jgi:hypothetical protein